MAIFLLRAKYGSDYEPPPATGTVFGDVPQGSFAAAWIEELAGLGITSGCGNGNYCPNAIVSRAQMAVFLLKTKEGPAYVAAGRRPARSSTTCPSDAYADSWIEDLYARGIAAGCSAGPAPLLSRPAPTTRGQMAVLLVKTFDLE